MERNKADHQRLDSRNRRGRVRREDSHCQLAVNKEKRGPIVPDQFELLYDLVGRILFLDLFGYKPLQKVVGRVIIQSTGLFYERSNTRADVLLVLVCRSECV